MRNAVGPIMLIKKLLHHRFQHPTTQLIQAQRLRTMLIKPVLASLFLILTFNVVKGSEYGHHATNLRRGATISCDGNVCTIDSMPDDAFPVCANDAGLQTCAGLFEAMYSRTMQASCVAWFSYEAIASDGFCYMCGGNIIPDVQTLLDGGCNSETLACENTPLTQTDEGTGWYRRTYCCHKDLVECVQFVEYVQDSNCYDETLGDAVMMSEPSCKFFIISSCPEDINVCDGL